MPIVVIGSMQKKTPETPNYIVPVPLKQPAQKYDHFLPKSECNFNSSSVIASKKIKYFAYDCIQPSNNWLLINSPEANYYDVLR
tara:strand:- start:972 stop:1223 length:252 start_codon:yes stop_codon:yes gene_type:complete